MSIKSKNAIVRAVKELRNSKNITGTVRVKVSEDENVIDVSFDNRKYIGRLRLEWKSDRFAVYLMDKAEGKVDISEDHASKSVYLNLKTASDARKFVKWYELTTQLAALGRNRS